MDSAALKAPRQLGRRRGVVMLIGVAALAVPLLPLAEASAKPTCQGRKATIVGDNGRDAIRSKGRRDDVIVARGGDDRIRSGGGRDRICAGGGDDDLDAGSGQDRLRGGGGDDRLDGGSGSDRIWGQGGHDLILGGPGGEVARGGPGDDRLYAGQQDDLLIGDAGNDVLLGEHGNERLRGGEGDDWLRAVAVEGLDGGPGNDWASFVLSPLFTPIIRGSRLELGGTDVENAVGSPFFDIFRGIGAPGSIVRGLGYRPDPDFPHLKRPEECFGFAVVLDCDPHLEDDGGGSVVELNPEGPDPGLHVLGDRLGEDLTISSTTSGPEVRSSRPLIAGRGCTGGSAQVVSCEFSGPLGYVLVSGERGNDSITIADSFGPTTTVAVDAGPGEDTISGGPGDEILFAGLPDYRAQVIIPPEPDLVRGGGGDDALIAFAGPDHLYGERGADQLVSTAACEDNTLSGGAGGPDIAGFARAGGLEGAPGVIARLGGSARRISGAGRCPSPDRVFADNEILEGTGGDDILTGDNRSNPLIIGHGGDDVIRGRGGYDKLRGDEGVDTLIGGGGPDILEARDGERDRRLVCGPGGLRVIRDATDPRGRGCQGSRRGR